MAELTKRLGVPSPAVSIRVENPPQLTTDLADYVRPLTGGLQVQAGIGSCSLGFMATLADSTHGFFTNSHCTETPFQYDVGDTVYQPFPPGYEVGQEYEDVTPIHGGDSIYSDAAFISVDSFLANSDYAFTVATTSNGTTIDSAHPTWPVSDDAIGLSAVTGQVVDKVGRTTGDTWGTVSQTCANVTVDSYTRLCDDQVYWNSSVNSPHPMVGGGDSGSPAYGFIYDQNGQNTDSVRIWGVLWGGEDNDSAFWFSDIDGMTNDFDIAITHE